MGSQALPANLLQRGLLCPWVHRSWQEPAPARARHRVTASFRHPPAPAWGPVHGLRVDICCTVDFHGLQETTCLTPWSFITSCKGRLSALAPGAPSPPSFFTELGVCRVISFTSSHSSLQLPSHCSFFFPFLTMLPQRRYHHHWLAWPWPAVGPSELAGTGSIGHGGSFLQLLTEATPVAPCPPCYQNLAMQTQNSRSGIDCLFIKQKVFNFENVI